MSDRFECYTRSGKPINEYELDSYCMDFSTIDVLECKLSDYDEFFVGYQLMVKLDLPDEMFKSDKPRFNDYTAKHPYK